MTKQDGRRWRAIAWIQLVVTASALWGAYEWKGTATDAIGAADASQAIARRCIGELRSVFEAPNPLVFYPDAPDAREPVEAD